MIKTDEEVSAFLEHYGVPGMKWGVRRARSHKQSSAEKRLNKQLRKAGQAYRGADEQKKQNVKKAAKIGAGIAIATGAAFVGYQMSKSAGFKASDLTAFEGHMRSAAKHRQQFMSGPSSTVPKAAAKKFTAEGAKTIAQMKAHHAESIRQANAELKRGYDSLQTPFPLREYLQER
jgi:hypothetical protein